MAGSWIHTIDDSWLEGHPAVCAFCLPGSGRFPSILTDDLTGGYLATRHLLEQGYRRIALINGPEHWWAAKRRLEGYRRALEEYGVAFEPAWVENGDWKPESGYRKALELLRRADLDGIFATNDYMAVGALWAASELGLKVPEQVGIIGFDNREVTQIARPKLSSVVLPMHEVGRLAAETLYRRIAEDGEVDVGAGARSVVATESVAPQPGGAAQWIEIAQSTGAVRPACGPQLKYVPCTLVVRNSSTSRPAVHEDEFPFY